MRREALAAAYIVACLVLAVAWMVHLNGWDHVLKVVGVTVLLVAGVGAAFLLCWAIGTLVKYFDTYR